MTRFSPRKSSPRLPEFKYRGTYAYFVTINSNGRQHVLRGQLAEECVRILLESARDCNFAVSAYCYMPDHAHLLVQGLADDSDLVRFMQRFKQLTGYRYKQGAGRRLWHRSYYDHVLRRDEDLHDIAAYIWYNPVHAGLVHDAADYPFSGPREHVSVYSGEPPVAVQRLLDAGEEPFFDRPEGLSVRPGADGNH